MVESDFRGLHHLSTFVPGQFVAGVVMYTGRQALRFGPGMYALPMSALWD